MGAIYHRGVKYTGVNMPDDYSIIGPEEKTATASRAYAVGEHFVKDGYFCTAIAVIAQGATLTLNTNYTQGSIDESLVSIVDLLNLFKLKTVVIPTVNLSAANLTCYSVGLMLYINTTINLPAGTYMTSVKYISGSSTYYYIPFAQCSDDDMNNLFPGLDASSIAINTRKTVKAIESYDGAAFQGANLVFEKTDVNTWFFHSNRSEFRTSGSTGNKTVQNYIAIALACVNTEINNAYNDILNS